MDIRVILHPTDLSPHSLPAYQYALRLATLHSARLLIVRTAIASEWATRITYGDARPQPSAYYEDLRADLRRRFRSEAAEVKIDHLVVEGEPVTAIVECAVANRCDLIVMGNDGQGRGLERWLFRSLSERVLEVAPCPVLVLKTPSSEPATARSASVVA